MQAKDIKTGSHYAVTGYKGDGKCWRVLAVIQTRQGDRVTSQIRAVPVDPEKPLDSTDPQQETLFDVADVSALWDVSQAQKREREELAEAKRRAERELSKLAAAIGGKPGYNGDVHLSAQRARELLVLVDRDRAEVAELEREGGDR